MNSAGWCSFMTYVVTVYIMHSLVASSVCCECCVFLSHKMQFGPIGPMHPFYVYAFGVIVSPRTPKSSWQNRTTMALFQFSWWPPLLPLRHLTGFATITKSMSSYTHLLSISLYTLFNKTSFIGLSHIFAQTRSSPHRDPYSSHYFLWSFCSPGRPSCISRKMLVYASLCALKKFLLSVLSY